MFERARWGIYNMALTLEKALRAAKVVEAELGGN
jgi:hypothetical protein